MQTEQNSANTLGLTGHTALVHRKDHEGMLQIDAFTGQVLPEQHERPEWAEGLIMAMLAERHTFYGSRLGPLYSEDMKSPEALAFEDLTWLGVETREDRDNAGDEITIEYDPEHRMEVMSSVVGIASREATDTADLDGLVEGAKVSVEMAYDNTRTGEEAKALIDATEEGFGEAQKAATGS